MNIELVLVDPTTRAESTVLLTAPPQTTAGDLAERLRPFHSGRRLFVNGRELTGQAPASDFALSDGTLIGIDRDVTIPSATAGPRLRFESGPFAGETVALGPGILRIGRTDGDLNVPDPEVSALHCELTVAVGATGIEVEVHDLGSTNGTGIDGVRISDTTALRPGQILHFGRTRCSLVVTAPPELETIPGPDGTLQIKFQKRVDVHPLPGAVRLRWPAPPSEIEPSKFPLLAMLLPLVFAVLMAYLMNRWFMLAFALMSPVMGFANWASERRKRKARKQGDGRKHLEAVEKATQRLNDATARESLIMRSRWPSIAETVETARLRSGRLWQRRPEDDDATELRVGTATVPAKSVEIEADRDADVPEQPELRDVPIGISLVAAGNIGIQGPDQAARATVRSLLLQLAVFHPPHQLTMSAVFRDAATEDFEWVRWLPHFRSGPVVHVGITPESSQAELERLVALVRERQTAKAEARGAIRFALHLAVIEDTGSLNATATDFVLQHGPEHGVHCIVVERGRERIPGPCRVAINVAAAPEGAGWIGSVELLEGATILNVDVEMVSSAMAMIAARSLAPLRPFAGGIDSGGSIPSVVRLLDEIGFRNLNADEVLNRWRSAPHSTSAFIGSSAAGPVRFDLAATPHGLVAGTTGTGKSQLLISMVGALAAANSPEDLNFVLVDFKGGGAFHRCAELPHTVAMLTNLSGGVERTIRSLDIELKRREAMFRAYDASLVDYERARQADSSIGPKVARLVVVIDEFAEFIGDHDELEAELESLARKGRSPGVHLILGTQAPSQAIRGKIDAQLELGIALRLKDHGESLHVIKDPAAALLPMEPRGRAFIRSAGTPTEFQVATLGLPVTGEVVNLPLHVQGRPWGEVTSTPPPPPVANASTTPNTDRRDLDELVDLLIDASDRGRVPAQRSPVLTYLPDNISMNELNATAVDGPRLWLEEHLWDQCHIPGGWLPEHGNLLLVGSPGSGRTTALRAVAGMLAATRAADELHLQVFDFGGALGALNDLHHVGTVADRTDRLRVKRLAEWLLAEIERRRNYVMVQNRAGSITELKARGIAVPPTVVVLFDQWEQAMQPDWEGLPDLLRTVFIEGPPVGITSVVSSDLRRITRIAEAMHTTIAMRLADRTGYADIFDNLVKAKDMPASIGAGRGFRLHAVTDDRVELIPVQFAHLGSTPDAGDQNDAIDYIRSATHAANATVPYRIDSLPRSISLSSALALGSRPSSRWSVPIGVGGDQLQLRWFDLEQHRVLTIAGEPGTGKTSALAMMRQWLDTAGIETVTIVNGEPSDLLRTLPGVLIPSRDLPDRAADIASDAVVFLDNVVLLEDPSTQAALESMIRSEGGPALVITAFPDDLRGLTRGVHKALATQRSGLLLAPGRRHDDVFGLRLNRLTPMDTPPGRAFLVVSAAPSLVHLPLPD